MLHQFLSAFDRDRRHPVDGAGGRTRSTRRLLHHLRHARDAFDGRGMRADHDGAAGFQRDQNLVDRGRCRIGRRDDRSHHTERLGNFDDAAIVVPCDDADGLHRPNEAIDLLRAEEILLDFVFDNPVSGLFDGEPRECLSLGCRRGGHRVDDRVDAFLAELGELEPCLPGAPREGAGFGNRGEIAIALGLTYGFRHRQTQRTQRVQRTQR